MRAVQNTALVVAAMALTLLLGELGARAWSYGKHSALADIIRRETAPRQVGRLTFDKPMLQTDPDLGSAMKPGVYHLALVSGEQRHNFTVTIGEDGWRVADAPASCPKGEIWLLGDSWVYGVGHNDNTTMGWLLQKRLPDYCVRNYSASGFGTVQAFVQVRKMMATGTRPAVIVALYADFHDIRNVASPKRLSQIAVAPGAENWLGDLKHARATLGSDGSVTVDYVPLLMKGLHEVKNLEALDPPPAYKKAVTQALLAGIARESNGARLLLGYLAGSLPLTAPEYQTVDMRAGPSDWDDFMPLDAHPGPKAQAYFAATLAAAIGP